MYWCVSASAQWASWAGRLSDMGHPLMSKITSGGHQHVSEPTSNPCYGVGLMQKPSTVQRHFVKSSLRRSYVRMRTEIPQSPWLMVPFLIDYVFTAPRAQGKHFTFLSTWLMRHLYMKAELFPSENSEFCPKIVEQFFRPRRPSGCAAGEVSRTRGTPSFPTCTDVCCLPLGK